MPSNSSAPLIFPIITTIIISLHFHPSMICAAPLAPALYVFGDSLLDHGNNNFLPTIAKADYLPYGKDFIHGSTGRFTNGKTVADFVAEFLGLPYSPPYLSIRGSLILTGLNYASAACGILSETGGRLGKCLNLKEQVDLFGLTVRTELGRNFKNAEEFSHYLSKSIFLVSIGSNDYLNRYMDTKWFDSNPRYNTREFTQQIVNTLSQQLERLYNFGGRKVIVFEIGPIGCIPTITRRHGGGSRSDSECVEEANQLVSDFNNMLPAMLNNLTSSLRGSKFVLGHANWLGYDAVLNPSKYGLEDSSNPCCTTWRNGTSSCIPLLNPCSNRKKNYFWDAFHLTESAYSLIASRCIHGNSVCIPWNVNDLVKI